MGQFSYPSTSVSLSVIFLKFLIIYSSRRYFCRQFLISVQSFFFRRNNKEREKRKWRGGENGARMSRIFSSFSFITSFRKYARLWSAHVFEVFRDLTFQKGAMNSLASILLRRAVLRHWDEQNENSRRTWKLLGRLRFLPSLPYAKSGPLSVFLRYLYD